MLGLEDELGEEDFIFAFVDLGGLLGVRGYGGWEGSQGICTSWKLKHGSDSQEIQTGI